MDETPLLMNTSEEDNCQNWIKRGHIKTHNQEKFKLIQYCGFLLMVQTYHRC